LLILLRSFIHAIILFFLLDFYLLLKQHVKRLFEITPIAAIVICSGRGGKWNGTHNKGSGHRNHSDDGSEICSRIEGINSSSGSNTCPTYTTAIAAVASASGMDNAAGTKMKAERSQGSICTTCVSLGDIKGEK